MIVLKTELKMRLVSFNLSSIGGSINTDAEYTFSGGDKP